MDRQIGQGDSFSHEIMCVTAAASVRFDTLMQACDRAYLHLWRECKHYDPEWVHAEMELRKARLCGQEADGSRFQ